MAYQHAQQAAELDRKHRRGWVTGSEAEPVLMVKLNDECEHDESCWKPTACGHSLCSRCDGHVDPGTRVVLKSAGPVITCNRRSKPMKEYEYVFEEWFAGSANLTAAIRTALTGMLVAQGAQKEEARKTSRQKVARPRDLREDAEFMDLRVKRNVNLAKKKMKEREPWYCHFAPPCTTCSQATGVRRRTPEYPNGVPDSEGERE